VYSFSGQKARVVQVYCDGKQIVVRLTNYLDFENVDNVKLLLRWMMNEPCGDTILAVQRSPTTSNAWKSRQHLGRGRAMS